MIDKKSMIHHPRRYAVSIVTLLLVALKLQTSRPPSNSPCFTAPIGNLSGLHGFRYNSRRKTHSANLLSTHEHRNVRFLC